MLSRPPTKITLTNNDIKEYEERKAARDAQLEREQQLNSSQDTSHSTVEDAMTDQDVSATDVTPAAQTRAAKSRAAREARILGSSSRG